MIETTGCLSGLFVGSGSNTQYSVVSVQWYSSGGACTNAGAEFVGYGGIPYNRFVFLADVFHYVPGQTGNYLAICVNGNCNNVTWTSPPPTNYVLYGYGLEMGNWLCCNTRLEGGYLANVQLYNTSLSANDIQALYLEGIGGAPIDLQHLVGWWPLNGNANDYSGNGNNGQINNVNFVSNWYSGYTPP